MNLRTLLLLLATLLLAPVAQAGTPASAFSLRDLQGNTVQLEDYRGKVIFVDFWATWCGPCKDAMPHWQRMYTELGEDGFVVLAITTDDARTKPQVKPFVRRSGYTFPVLYDTDSSALVVYNPNKTLPFSVLIDRNFEVASIHSGYNPGDEVSLREEVEHLLAQTVGGDEGAAEAPDTSAPADAGEDALRADDAAEE